MKFKFLLFFAVPLLVILASRIPLFQNYELTLYDVRLQLRPQLPVSNDIAIIEIDDITLARLGSWPLPRDFHASLVDVLSEVGARAVFFDLLFSEPAVEDPFLSQSLQKAGNVYLPQVFDISSSSSGRDVMQKPAAVRVPIADSLSASMRGTGHINVFVDADGKIRRAPVLIKNSQNQLVPQMSLQLACLYEGLDCGKIETDFFHIIVDDHIRIPVTGQNEVTVNYPGPWKSTFHHYSYLEILKAYQLWKENGADSGVLKELKNKICFIGTTAVGTVDIRATPLEANYPMLGLHASLLNSFIGNKYIQRVPSAVNDLIVIVLLFLTLMLSLTLAPLLAFASTVGSAIGFLLIATLLLDGPGIWIDAFYPVVVILTTYLGATLWRWFKEIQERLVLEREMQVASDLQSQFLIQPDQKADNLSVAQWFKPAKFVAGDLFDIFKIDATKAGLLIGDVSGKGLPAALLMAQAISSFRIFSRQISEPHEVFRRLNDLLGNQNTGRFVTAMYCVVDIQARNIRVCSAGQGPFLVYRQNSKTVDVIEPPGKAPLGLMPDTSYQTLVFDFHPGDKIILFSDGVTEARDTRNNEFGQDHVIQGVLESSGADCSQTLESLKNKLEAFAAPHVHHDDITLIVASFRD